MKVEWPAGLAAAGLLATSGASSKRGIFSMRPNWLTRKLSHTPSSGTLPAPGGSPTPITARALGRAPSLGLDTASESFMLSLPAKPALFHGLRVSSPA